MTPDEIVGKVLAARGVAREDAVREVLSPRPKLTHDPLLLPDMEAAADFLSGALRAGRRVCVYGDYDVDGVCGTALLVGFLRAFLRGNMAAPEPRVTYYIPNRIEEGYGLNRGALDAIRARGDEVVVTVDCGSVSVAEAAYAKEIGLDIVITDHHEMDAGGAAPDCLVVNPKRPGSAYPFAGLCGAAVAFKLCCAMFDRAHGRQDAAPTNASVGAGLAPPASRAALNALVDLVAVATVADVMPLTDENRTFVKYGLAMLREGRRPALACLLGVAGIDPARVSSRDIAFGVAPRINAAGRLEDAAAGVELFLTDDPARMREIAQRMDALNRERQAIQKKCVDDCMALARDAGPFLLLRPPAAHEGVSGIVAGKVREATGLPCAVVAESADDGALYLKGSARSAGRLDLIALLRRHEEFFVRVGGHAAAAGFLIRAGDEEQLRAALCADLAALLADDPALLDEEETVDADVAPEDVTEALADALAALAPFGAGWREPLLSFTALPSDITDVRAMGADGAHGRFKAAGVPCTWFRWDPDLLGKPLQITGTLGWNHFRGQKILQFTVAKVQDA